VARGDTARALLASGCERRGLFGTASFPPDRFSVVAEPAELREPPATVLVATKSFTSGAVARSLADTPEIASGQAPIVLAQNGLGNAEIFCERFAPGRVWNARVITGFRRVEPHCVEITVHADPILLGSLFGESHERLAGLAEAIARGGIPAETTPAIGEWLWAKALYNCALNPLGAILRLPYGAVGREQRSRNLMDCVVREVFDVMAACGERTRWADADDYLRFFYETLLPATAEHESSMLQDVRAGRRTEIDALCGEIVRRGDRAGVPTPVNDALAQLVRSLEPDTPTNQSM
jgi:2-dehydropantoate 2-reductase